jgi:hypothetical protein
MNYQTQVTGPHERDEELQWARILDAGDDARGMILVFIQKLCTAFHEIGPAIEAGIIRDETTALDYLRRRLAARIRKVLEAMDTNGLAHIKGAQGLRNLLDQTLSAGSPAALAELTEPIHTVNHTLCDALETP